MTILSTQNLGRAFGAVDVFDDINIAIPQNARIAIVGPNGVGKTTLLRILAGEDSPSQGSVHSARGLKIAYLPPQTAVGDIPGTLWDFCLMAFENLLEMGAQLQTLERRMANGDDSPELLQDYGKLQTRFDDLGGYTYISRLQHTLSGLGFDESDFYRPLNQLSGGQRTRARLAKLLLEDPPDLLLLDEPTNHLDIQAVEWLEAWLRAWKGAAIIVSHDRYFLDQTASWIWEMTPPPSKNIVATTPPTCTSARNVTNVVWRNIKPSKSISRSRKITSNALSTAKTPPRHADGASAWNALCATRCSPTPPTLTCALCTCA